MNSEPPVAAEQRVHRVGLAVLGTAYQLLVRRHRVFVEGQPASVRFHAPLVKPRQPTVRP